MSVLAMFCYLGINLNGKKSFNHIANQILNTAYLSQDKILIFNQVYS